MNILMCSPNFYGIKYEINPWMDLNVNSIDNVAQEQWNNLHDIISLITQKPYLIDMVNTLPDMVFTANAGFVFDKNKVLLSNFKFLQRKQEKDYFCRWFWYNNFKTTELPENYNFEGEGDVFILENKAFIGYPFRTDYKSHKIIGNILEKEPISLELINPYFYHLDTCFCLLQDNKALVYSSAFSKAAQRYLYQNFDVIEVEEDEAKNFICNSIVINYNVIMNKNCEKTKDRLLYHGYNVEEVDTSEFLKAGGGPKCMVLFLGEQNE